MAAPMTAASGTTRSPGGARPRRPVRLGRLVLWSVNTIVCLFLLAPILVVIVASFSRDAYLAFPPRGLSLRWYREFLASRDFVNSLLLSLRLAAAATAIATVVGLLAALGLTARRFRGAGTARGLLTSPLTVPGIVAGIAMLIYYSRVGLGGSFVSLLAAHVVLVLPFVVIIVSSGLQAFDRSIEEAARSLGAGRVTAFVTVTLPLIKGSVLAAAVFAFITSFDEVVVTLFLAGPRMMTLPVRIFQYIEYNSDPLVAAVSTVLVVFTVAVVLIVDRVVGFSRLF
jgi:putative spermidine/putrescine transport system permease protein